MSSSWHLLWCLSFFYRFSATRRTFSPSTFFLCNHFAFLWNILTLGPSLSEKGIMCSTLPSCPSSHLSFGMLLQDLQAGLSTESCSNMGGNFKVSRQLLIPEKKRWHTPMGWHCCRVRMLILSSVITRCSDCSMIPALLFASLSHPVQSEYLNSPNTGRFTVLTVDFALCLHRVMGVFTKLLAIVSFWDGKVSWSTHSLTGGKLL